MLTSIKGAFSDMAAALRLKNVWMALASEDIGDAHKRTTLGPLWLLVNYLMFTFIIVFIIRGASGIEHFLAYVACGLSIWLFVSEIVGESVVVFVRQESFIKGTVLPMSIYVFRQCARSVIRAAYALIGTVGIVAFSGLTPSVTWLSCIPAILLVIAVAPPVVIIFGVIGVVFRDIRYFLAAIMRLGMFITPIFWSHENRGGMRAALYYYSPFTHFIEIFRMPIISGQIQYLSWVVCIAVTVVLWIVAILILGRFRKRIVFML